MPVSSHDPIPTPIAVRTRTAAVMMDCSRQHINQLIERGVLRRIQIEGSTAIRVPVADIYAALDMEPPAEAGQ